MPNSVKTYISELKNDVGKQVTLSGWLTGEKHIRQCIAFPRMMDKVYI